MDFGMKYFTEDELQPVSADLEAVGEVDDLLNAAELNDIAEFARAFSRKGESIFSRSRFQRKPHVRTFIKFLYALGAIRLEKTVQGIKVESAGRLAQHLPEILSIYLSDSLTLVDNWNLVHIVPEDSLSALGLMRQLELRRIELTRRAGSSPRPLAERPVAFAVFHAKDQKDRDCYLFEVNKDWRRLNLIGGKQEDVDGGDFSETLLREISEELGISRDRLTITRLNDKPLPGFSISGNVGSLARYPCVLFGVRVDGPLKTRMQDKWLTEGTIREYHSMRTGPLMVNPVYLNYLLDGRPSRISRTPLSTEIPVRSTNAHEILERGESSLHRWSRVLNENRDLLLTIIALVAAVITLVVEIV